MKYRKKPVVIEATQWFTNGDHPKDHDPIGIENPTQKECDKYHEYLQSEGAIVRRYRTPGLEGQTRCTKCGNLMHDHGWLETLEGGNDGAQVVCPGDFIITGVSGENYPYKPDIFKKTYEKVELATASAPEEPIPATKISHPLFTNKYTVVIGYNRSKHNVTALHDFEVTSVEEGKLLGSIHFQQGPIKEDGVNGVMNEDILLMVVNRLQTFQKGQFSCRENALALTKLEEAVLWLRARTMGREQRGIEGTHQVLGLYQV